jgi:hypothetical protein
MPPTKNASSVHEASDLSPHLRRAVEALLGRAVEKNENVSVRAFRGEIMKQAPTGEARERSFRRLRGRIDETAKRAHGVPEEEIDAAILVSAEKRGQASKFRVPNPLKQSKRRRGISLPVPGFPAQ